MKEKYLFTSFFIQSLFVFSIHMQQGEIVFNISGTQVDVTEYLSSLIKLAQLVFHDFWLTNTLTRKTALCDSTVILASIIVLSFSLLIKESVMFLSSSWLQIPKGFKYKSMSFSAATIVSLMSTGGTLTTPSVQLHHSMGILAMLQVRGEGS